MRDNVVGRNINGTFTGVIGQIAREVTAISIFLIRFIEIAINRNLTFRWDHLLLRLNDMELLNLSFIMEVAAPGWSSSTQNLASLIQQYSNRTTLWYVIKSSSVMEDI